MYTEYQIHNSDGDLMGEITKDNVKAIADTTNNEQLRMMAHLIDATMTFEYATLAEYLAKYDGYDEKELEHIHSFLPDDTSWIKPDQRYYFAHRGGWDGDDILETPQAAFVCLMDEASRDGILPTIVDHFGWQDRVEWTEYAKAA